MLECVAISSAVRLPNVYSYGTTLGVIQRFNRFEIALRSLAEERQRNAAVARLAIIEKAGGADHPSLTPALTTLAEVMTHNPKTVSASASFNAALELMHEGRFRHVPVVEDSRPVGVVTARDALGPELEDFVYEMLRQDQVSQVLA